MSVRPQKVGSALTAAIGLALLIGCRKPGAGGCSDGQTCYRQGRALLAAYPLGRGSPEEAARIIALLQKACDLSSGRACELLAGQLEVGNLGPSDPSRVVPLYDRACTLREVRSCYELRRLYEEGRGVPKDHAMAMKYRQLACDLADSLSRGTFCEWNTHSPIYGAVPN
jgi:TPR repeat protein